VAAREVWKLAGREVEVKNLDKVFWPEQGYTKGDLLRYYREVAPVILPYLRGRPLTLLMCPDGVGGGCYIRRKRPDFAPDWLPYVLYNPKTRAGQVPLVLVENEAHLIWLANGGRVSRLVQHHPRPGSPRLAGARPGPGRGNFFRGGAASGASGKGRAGLTGFAGLAQDQRRPRFARLAAARARPLQPRPGARLGQGLCRPAGRKIVGPDQAAPRRYHRGAGVHVDYAQNGYGRNTVAPYSLRAKPGAPVSTPLGWDEVEAGGFAPADFNLKSVPERVSRLGDLFAGVLQKGQRLPELAG